MRQTTLSLVIIGILIGGSAHAEFATYDSPTLVTSKGESCTVHIADDDGTRTFSLVVKNAEGRQKDMFNFTKSEWAYFVKGYRRAQKQAKNSKLGRGKSKEVYLTSEQEWTKNCPHFEWWVTNHRDVLVCPEFNTVGRRPVEFIIDRSNEAQFERLIAWTNKAYGIK